jgi:hypothetical protein
MAMEKGMNEIEKAASDLAMELGMQDTEKAASDLEHYAQVLHDQVRRGYYPAEIRDRVLLQIIVKILDRISEELCEAQEAYEDRKDTEDYLGRLLDAEGIKASLQALTIKTYQP